MPQKLDDLDFQKIAEAVAQRTSKGGDANIGMSSRFPLIWIPGIVFAVGGAVFMYLGVVGDIREISRRLDEMKPDRWTFSMEKDRAQQFNQINPAVREPDVQKIHDYWTIK